MVADDNFDVRRTFIISWRIFTSHEADDNFDVRRTFIISWRIFTSHEADYTIKSCDHVCFALRGCLTYIERILHYLK